MEFVRAPAGSFTMGKFAPTCAPMGYQDNVTEAQHAEWVKMAAAAARPGFKATVPRAFYIGKFEVTQEQYRKVRPDSPCLGRGIAIPHNGGRDFWGNPLPDGKLDLGAFQHRAK